MKLLIFVTVVIIILFAIWRTDKNKGNLLIKKHIEEEENRRKVILDQNNQVLNTLKGEFSSATKIINYSFKKFILIDENNSTLLINNNIYKFKEIVDFKITDNSKEIYSPSTSVTTANTGSMICRAIIGGVISGGVGVIIGGSTGKKTTVNSGGESNTKHSFSVVITINDISNPIEKIEIGENENATNEIISVLNIIIARNSKEHTSKEVVPVVNTYKNFKEYNYWDEDTLKNAVIKLKETQQSEIIALDLITERSGRSFNEAKEYLKNI